MCEEIISIGSGNGAGRHVLCCNVFAVCCSVLQHVAVCLSVMKCAACDAVCCRVLPCVAVCCSVLQCVVACCSMLQLAECVEASVTPY